MMSAGTPNNSSDSLISDEEADRLALGAAEAINRLVAERNALRNEVTRLRVHVAAIRESYRKLATELLTQVQLIENLESDKRGSEGVLEFPRVLRKKEG